LDNRYEWPIKSCDLPIMSARPNNANDRKAYMREYMRHRRAALSRHLPFVQPLAAGEQFMIGKARRDEPRREVPIAKGYDREPFFASQATSEAAPGARRHAQTARFGRVTSSAMRSDVFYPKAVRLTEVPRFPFGRQWAASMPSAGAALPSDSFLVGPSSC
jgi:hypothetical protein